MGRTAVLLLSIYSFLLAPRALSSQATAPLPAPMAVHSRQTIPVQFQRLPDNAAVIGLAVNTGWAAWAVPVSGGSRLYLARLDAFRPFTVSSQPASILIGGPYLSAHWLVWTELHATAFDLHDMLTICAMNLISRRSVSWSIPFTDQVLRPGVALSGDTLVWTRQQ